MHYAIHGHTAAELIVERANADKEHMGLTTWEKAPNGKIVKTDVSVAKNYLRENELEEMGRIVNASLDMAENMAKRHIPMTMEDWANRIDKFIDVAELPILQDNGNVSAEFAKEFAETEFEKYRVIQDRLFQSDFDRFSDGNLLPLDIEWYGGKKQRVSILIFRFKTRRFVVICYLDLSKIFKSSIIAVIPATAIRTVHKPVFQINAECKISAFAIMMLAKKENSTTSMIIKI